MVRAEKSFSVLYLTLSREFHKEIKEMSMIIRNGCLEDLQQVISIEQINFSEAEAASKKAMQERLTIMTDTFLVAEINGRLAGYIEGPVIKGRYLTDDLFHKVSEFPVRVGGFIGITSLSIHPDFKGQGIGTALLAAMKDLVVSQERDGISLTCHDDLISFYEMNGFKDEGESDSKHGGSLWYNMIWNNPTRSIC